MNTVLGSGGRQCESDVTRPLIGRKLQRLITAQNAKKAKRLRKSYSTVQTKTGIVVIPVMLTKGYHALVSEADYERVTSIKWRASVRPDGAVYARAHVPGSGRRGKSMEMHRFIMDAQPGERIDHWDGDGLHNWRENLRRCTNAQNIRNQQPHRTGKSTSKFKGVYRKPNGEYRAQIMCQYRKISLGLFASETDAARAYDEAAVRLFGAFARLNYPPASLPSPATRQHGGAA